MALSCITLLTIGGADSIVAKNIADQELFFAPVPKAVCGPGDSPELALQGQGPIALRMQSGGFLGNSCNLKLLSSSRGAGASWQAAEWREGKGKTRKVCAYHDTAAPTVNPTIPRAGFGVRVLDITDATKPVTTAYLTTTPMLDPWESLKINERRKLLGGVQLNGPMIDVYDISGDCRYPQLLSSATLGTVDGGGIVATATGHEGSWAPDGLTYYSMGSRWFAIDTADTTKPKLISTWDRTLFGLGGQHGMSISEDGMRGYWVGTGSLTFAGLQDDTVKATDGLMILDLSDIQTRKPNALPKLVGHVEWKDGSVAQHTIPIKIKGKPYVVFVDEGGSPGARTGGCPAGFALFPMARIIDISDETNPKVISKLMLETHDPVNCDKVNPDLVGLSGFLYGSHYCSVDNRLKATTLACGYFNSGIRVFDIRDPIRPREIAYYNPPATNQVIGGSEHGAGRTTQPGGPDWCSASVHLDAEMGTLWSTCQDNGFFMLRFTHNAWPFVESSTPPGMQTN
jgi:hypothetical protein